MAADTLKCLFVSPVVPYPPDSGGRIRTFRLLRELRGKAEVHLRAVFESPESVKSLRELEQHCASVQGFARATPDAWRRLTRPKLERWFHSANLETALASDLASGRFDLVHLDEMFLARALAPGVRAPIVVHHHKLDTQFQELVPISNRVAGAFDRFKLRRLEACAARRTKFHVLTSAEDARALKGRYPRIETAVVESGFDPEYFRPPSEPRVRDVLLFMGSMDYAPNVDGLVWFVREVLPKILAERANVQLEVLGTRPTEAVRLLAGPHVSILGAAADVRPQLSRASALIVPLRIGGGTRVKIVEAMGCETPVVSTTIGAEGLLFRDPQHLWIADSAAAFAARTLEVLGDPDAARACARRGRALALEHYQWSDLAGKLLAAWKRTVEG